MGSAAESAINRRRVSASMPSHFGCATTDRRSSRGAVMMPMKRASRLLGAGLAPVCTVVLAINWRFARDRNGRTGTNDSSTMIIRRSGRRCFGSDGASSCNSLTLGTRRRVRLQRRTLSSPDVRAASIARVRHAGSPAARPRAGTDVRHRGNARRRHGRRVCGRGRRCLSALLESGRTSRAGTSSRWSLDRNHGQSPDA